MNTLIITLIAMIIFTWLVCLTLGDGRDQDEVMYKELTKRKERKKK